MFLELSVYIGTRGGGSLPLGSTCSTPMLGQKGSYIYSLMLSVNTTTLKVTLSKEFKYATCTVAVICIAD